MLPVGVVSVVILIIGKEGGSYGEEVCAVSVVEFAQAGFIFEHNPHGRGIKEVTSVLPIVVHDLKTLARVHCEAFLVTIKRSERL